tara:strand:- start:411 stop:653 length:243 start_codon:yes stop_codon:yes gene_type:complete
MSEKFEGLSKQVKSNLANLSTQDFRTFGIEHIAYIRSSNIRGRALYNLFSADGQKLHTADTMQDAVNIARQRDLEPVTVH